LRIVICTRFTDGEQLSTAHRLRNAVAHRRWGADLVVVVTWHNKSLEWLAERYPLNHTRFMLYVKGDLRSCNTDIPAVLEPAVVGCHHMHNAGGRESHTIAHFAASHYASLPRLTSFVQDDGLHALSLPPDMSEAAFRDWVALAESRPFSSREACLCDVVEETFWTQDRYYWYEPMRWFIDTFLDFDVAAANWTAVRWPTSANLVVPRAAVRSRPRALYALIEQMFNGTLPASRDDIARNTRLVYQMQQPSQMYGMYLMGHVFERLWFAIFDVNYSPHQADYDTRPPATDTSYVVTTRASKERTA
jgi:hypothetical protein